jgi:hypothetical protein
MPDTFYVRTGSKSQYVEAKFLKDINGNPIVSRNQIQSSWNLFDSDRNPIGTNADGYVIVPADFDMKTAIDLGRSVARSIDDSSGDPDAMAGNSIGAMARFTNAFLPKTGWLDIQTHYNGTSGDNVPAFRDGASYVFGVAGHAAKLSVPAAISMGLAEHVVLAKAHQMKSRIVSMP